MAEKKNEKYIVTELKAPFDEEYNKKYSEWATRVLWLDPKVVPGAFHFSCSWYLKPPDQHLEKHTHDYDEMLGFFGSNPDDPYDLGGEIEFWLEDEQYTLTKSCIIFVPKGMEHCPLKVKRVDRPIFHLGGSI